MVECQRRDVFIWMSVNGGTVVYAANAVGMSVKGGTVVCMHEFQRRHHFVYGCERKKTVVYVDECRRRDRFVYG